MQFFVFQHPLTGARFQLLSAHQMRLYCPINFSSHKSNMARVKYVSPSAKQAPKGTKTKVAKPTGVTKKTTAKAAKTASATASEQRLFTTKEVKDSGRKEDFSHKGRGKWVLNEGAAPANNPAPTAKVVKKKAASSKAGKDAPAKSTNSASPKKKDEGQSKVTKPSPKPHKKGIFLPPLNDAPEPESEPEEAPAKKPTKLKLKGPRTRTITETQRRRLEDLRQQAIDLYFSIEEVGPAAGTILEAFRVAVFDKSRGFPSLIGSPPPTPRSQRARGSDSPEIGGQGPSKRTRAKSRTPKSITSENDHLEAFKEIKSKESPLRMRRR